ncbi:hypothetical protein BDC45DRAFT_525364 [Circinella umbellata]|nr:hypothetical protein BDC45DRAFT_525364 [Circinella umbellata]
MQIKFITLTVSAVLAISALSANALPTSKRGATGQDLTTQADTTDVSPEASTSNTSQKTIGLTSLSDNLTNLATDLLDTVECLLGEVVNPLLKRILGLVENILNGTGNQQGLIEELLEAVQELLQGDKPGRFDNGAGAQEPIIPILDSDGILDCVVNLVKNLLCGYSAEESGVGGVITLLENLLDSLLGAGTGPSPQDGANYADKLT